MGVAVVSSQGFVGVGEKEEAVYSGGRWETVSSLDNKRASCR
jgi:hypothetical protein